jgi:hypothetical protein
MSPLKWSPKSLLMLCLLVIVGAAASPPGVSAQERVPPPTSSFRLETLCCPIKGQENKVTVKGTVYEPVPKISTREFLKG